MIAQLDRQKKALLHQEGDSQRVKICLAVKSALKNMSKLDKWWRKEVVCLKQTNKKNPYSS